MARSITVKVATPKVIKALETKLATLKTDKENEASNEAKFQDALKAWREQIAEYAIANFAKAENLRTNYRSWNKTLNVDFDITTNGTDFPAEPQRDFTTIHDHTYREMVEEINNALNILKMTDEETVNASTMKSIAQYL
jgi:predicted nucleic acid-binding protein